VLYFQVSRSLSFEENMTGESASLRQAGRSRGPRRWRRIALALLILVVVFCSMTLYLFVWPDTGMPARVDAIAILGGPGDRLGLGLRLAQQGRAPYVLLSEGLPADNLLASLCKPHGSFTVICWNPIPGNTKGEAEFVGRLARQRHWTSVALVTTPDQAWRAALYVRRCYPGKIYSVTTPLSWSQWPYQIVYQWAAAIKAETTQRGC
jgi:uncharacterized SAM-binding protein YcdF (DUF218 family)